MILFGTNTQIPPEPNLEGIPGEFLFEESGAPSASFFMSLPSSASPFFFLFILTPTKV
jgi:hypothetical protein